MPSSGTLAVLAVVPRWHLDRVHGPERLRAAAQALRSALDELVAGVDGVWADSDGESWLALIPEPGEAWDVALTSPRHVSLGHVSLALGLGEVALDAGSVYGDEASRARRLAWLAPEGSVLCTSAMLRGAGLPQGIGAHEIPEELALRLGFGAYQLVDYRG